MVASNGRKKGTGRKKVEIKKIEKKKQLNVTFSKRRQGLFNKARELCALCGGEVGIIVFSPTGRLHCFGYPSVNSVIDRFINNGYCLDNQRNARQLFVKPQREISSQFGSVADGYCLDSHENEQQVVVGSPEGGICSGFCWDLPIEDMGLDMLLQYKAKLEEIKAKACNQADSQMDYLSIDGDLDGIDVGILHGLDEGRGN